MSNTNRACRSPILPLMIIIILGVIFECIPQEAEARRAFGRRQGAVRRVNRGRGVAQKNNGGRRKNNNNDIFGLDLEPVNALSSLAIDPFGTLQRINGLNNVVTNGNGRFFVVDQRANNLALQAELLRNSSGSGFFGSINPFNAAFNPSISTDAFNQIQFLNTLGTLGTSCRGGSCSLR